MQFSKKYTTRRDGHNKNSQILHAISSNADVTLASTLPHLIPYYLYGNTPPQLHTVVSPSLQQKQLSRRPFVSKK
jgi:hypothetical protein